VTGSGNVEAALRIFTSGEEPALIVTTPEGERRLRAEGLSPAVGVAAVPAAEGRLTAASIIGAVRAHLPAEPQRLLLEGGPQLMGTFYAENALDEQFLTLAPQVAGRDSAMGAAGWRPGLVEGALLAPEQPAWGRLRSVKQAGSHLFLRYAFDRDTGRATPD
jgi:riboflavin biosynthesis pyrimidine reductase